MGNDDDVLVIGGGVIGLATALALVEAGRGVRVLESRTIGSGSSHGNCGTLTPSHAAPLAAPGMVAKALRWMLTPDAPFYVAPRIDPALWQWLLRFSSRCNGRDWRSAMQARAALLLASRALFPDWVARHRLDCDFTESGMDYLFRTPAALEHFRHELPLLAELGIASESIDGDDYVRREPALKPGLAGVVRFPGDARLRPDRYVAALAQALRAAGGTIEEQRDVIALDPDGTGATVHTAQGRWRAREVVIATGAWSPALAKAAGLRALPVQPGKGYSITYDPPPLVPSRPVVLPERSVCVTSWDGGFRLGSTMEFSGYDTRLNRRRLDAIERGAAEYLVHPVGPAKREEWYGWRPLACDDLPIIGRVPGRDHLWLATGHGMLGVSMSTGTAELLADMICARTPRIDMAPFSPARFA
ncbi:NAD(P)/FAD-dependent oxidoreductase [Luteimonas vadosa]|uniref:FAD-dependent oxidoreductase n=1 Tax=Luteimonas vadosa TaxID=1165507 RepID=A0ABP9E7Z9_9GAMM